MDIKTAARILAFVYSVVVGIIAVAGACTFLQKTAGSGASMLCFLLLFPLLFVALAFIGEWALGLRD